MDSGGAAIIGALVGAGSGLVTSVVTTLLTEHLRSGRANKLDVIRKGVLERLLTGSKYEWRAIGTLADAIGADEETTARLLLEIGARRSLAKGRDSWGLKDWPDDLKSN